MKMSVIGCGHLGATHAACMASIGHDVQGIRAADWHAAGWQVFSLTGTAAND